MRNFFIKRPKFMVDDLKLNSKEESVFRRYKKSAEYRGHSFQLSHNQFTHLINSDCFYCGEKPRVHFNGVIRNGIDRVENQVGYRLDNVITSCTDCNKMKGTLSFVKFSEKCSIIHKKVSEFQRLRDVYGPESPELLSHMFRFGRYLSPNELLLCISNGLLKKSDIAYKFSTALKEFPYEYEIVRKQMSRISGNIKKLTRKFYNKQQLKEWDSINE